MQLMGHLIVPSGEFHDAEPQLRELANPEENVKCSLNCRSSVLESALHSGTVELTFIWLDRVQSTAYPGPLTDKAAATRNIRPL